MSSAKSPALPQSGIKGDLTYGSQLLDTMHSDGRLKAYKFVAYAAVTFSVVAVLSVVCTLPMVYNYVSQVRLHMRSEISYCKVSVLSILFLNTSFLGLGA